MKYVIRGHDRFNAVHELLICMLPDERHFIADSFSEGEDRVFSSYENGVASAEAAICGKTSRAGVKSEGEDVKQVTYAVKTALFEALSALVPAPAWGSVTGVKPAKAYRAAVPSGTELEKGAEMFRKIFFCDEHRARLTALCAGESERVGKSLENNEIQLYVGIPFCPSRCSYCSFVSSEIKERGGMIPDYLEALRLETAAASRALRGKRLGSVYIGGGTPTILTAPQLDGLLSDIKRAFELMPGAEWTVEGGRPDTLNGDKLAVLAGHGVGRLSINPQSSSDAVLRAVGRPHTWRDTVRVYEMARGAGEFAINMDLIAGLPGDSEQGLIKSVTDVLDLCPEDLTLHSLALKKGADLRFGPRGVLERETLDLCHRETEARGYRPYYLYKQKYSAGGLENVGFTRGAGCRYNVVMMEESGDVAALGAGGVSKLTGGGGIMRLQNPKYPTEYIQRIQDAERRWGSFPA